MDQSELLLSAEELLNLRKPPPLANVELGGQKGYSVDGEEEVIQSFLEQKRQMLSIPRAAKLSDLMKAKWDNDLKKAVVDSLKGKVSQHMGKPHNRQHILCPEETIFLMELGVLELSYGNKPLSTEEAYMVALPREWAIYKFVVYANLTCQGYIVVPHQGKIDMKPLSYIGKKHKKRQALYQGNRKNAKKRAADAVVENLNGDVEAVVETLNRAAEVFVEDQNEDVEAVVENLNGAAEGVVVNQNNAAEEFFEDQNGDVEVVVEDENRAIEVVVGNRKRNAKSAARKRKRVGKRGVAKNKNKAADIAAANQKKVAMLVAENRKKVAAVLVGDQNSAMEVEENPDGVAMLVAGNRRRVAEVLVEDQNSAMEVEENPDGVAMLVAGNRRRVAEVVVEKQKASGSVKAVPDSAVDGTAFGTQETLPCASDTDSEATVASVTTAEEAIFDETNVESVDRDKDTNDDLQFCRVSSVEEENLEAQRRASGEREVETIVISDTNAEVTSSSVDNVVDPIDVDDSLNCEDESSIDDHVDDSCSSSVADDGTIVVKDNGAIVAKDDEAIVEVRGDSSDSELSMHVDANDSFVESDDSSGSSAPEDNDEEVMIVAVEKKKKVLAVIDLLSDEENESDVEQPAIDDDVQIIGEVIAADKKDKKLKATQLKQESRFAGESDYLRRPVDANFNANVKWPFPNLLRKTVVCLPRPPPHLLPMTIRLTKEAYTVSLRMVTADNNNVPTPRLWNSYRDLQERRNSLRGGPSWGAPQHPSRTFPPDVWCNPPRPNFLQSFAPNPQSMPATPFRPVKSEPFASIVPPPNPFVSPEVQSYIEHAQRAAAQVAEAVLQQMTMRVGMRFPSTFSHPQFPNYSSQRNMFNMPQNNQPWCNPNLFNINPPVVPPRQAHMGSPSPVLGLSTAPQNPFNSMNQGGSPNGMHPQQGSSNRNNGNSSYGDMYPCSIPKVRAETSSWNEFKSALGEDASDEEDDSRAVEIEVNIHSAILWSNDIQPLIKSGIHSLEAASDSLEMSKPADIPEDTFVNLCSTETCNVEISYDVYLPGTRYKKTCPSIPHHRIIVTTAEKFQGVSNMVLLQNGFSDSASLQIAMIDSGDTVFYSVNGVNIPTLTCKPLIPPFSAGNFD